MKFYSIFIFYIYLLASILQTNVKKPYTHRVKTTACGDIHKKKNTNKNGLDASQKTENYNIRSITVKLN